MIWSYIPLLGGSGCLKCGYTWLDISFVQTWLQIHRCNKLTILSPSTKKKVTLVAFGPQLVAFSSVKPNIRGCRKFLRAFPPSPPSPPFRLWGSNAQHVFHPWCAQQVKVNAKHCYAKESKLQLWCHASKTTHCAPKQKKRSRQHSNIVYKKD